MTQNQRVDPRGIGSGTDPQVDRAPETRPVHLFWTSSNRAGWVLWERVVGLVFGVVQALIGLRILLLVLDANGRNGIVAAILNVTNVLVDPFRGVLRLDRIAAGSGSVLDVAAIVAIVGWTLVEALILALLRLGEGSSDSPL
jgi:YggT family protein